jgi:SAM-dependent MidA family methyltransferase
VFANELLDNIPFDLATRTADGWWEARVGMSTDGSVLELQHVAASDAVAASARRAMPEGASGALVPVFDDAAAWVRDAVTGLELGRVVVIDYATATTSELVDRGSDGWLRTFRGHERLGHPRIDLGSADITADVALDQLAHAAGPVASTVSQAEFLRAHGIDELVEEGRQPWEAGAAAGDLAALKARSRVREAEALLDPAGLGGFLVAQWVV